MYSFISFKYHLGVMKNVKEASKKTNIPVAIMLDTKGPEIRSGMLKDHTPIELKEGQTLEITDDPDFIGNISKIGCSYKNLKK